MRRRALLRVSTGGLLLATACSQGVRAAAPEPTRSVDPTAPRIVVEVVRQRVPAGEYVEVVVRRENLGPEGVSTVTFGDGAGGPGSALSDAACGPVVGASGERRARHAYRRAGTWTVTATLVASCDGGPPIAYSGTATVEVTDAEVPTNGPEQPAFHNTLTTERPDGAVRFQVGVGDPDGYLTELRYAWGDGSEDTVFPFPLSECVDPRDRWPVNERATSATSLDDAPWLVPEHRYARAGTYVATVTAVTTGCDGGTPQRATHTETVTVEG